MKGKAAAFMAVLAIAAAFGLGAGIYLERSASNYAFAGDIVYGERDSAGDFAVSESLVLSEHLRLSTLYSPAGGESRAESDWGSFPRTDIWRPPSVEFDFTEAEVAGDVEDLLQDNALLRSIYEDISQEYDGSDDFLATFDLADYTDTYTVTPVLGSMDDGYVDLRGGEHILLRALSRGRQAAHAGNAALYHKGRERLYERGLCLFHLQYSFRERRAPGRQHSARRRLGRVAHAL